MQILFLGIVDSVAETLKWVGEFYGNVLGGSKVPVSDNSKDIEY
jgi:hypothetical protein